MVSVCACMCVCVSMYVCLRLYAGVMYAQEILNLQLHTLCCSVRSRFGEIGHMFHSLKQYKHNDNRHSITLNYN